MDPFIGEIRLVGFLFVPKGWAACDGSLMPVQSNAALFSLLGTTYGGNGTTNFALPDLRGRAAVGIGQGPGLSPRNNGEAFGAETRTLSQGNLPTHTHQVQGAVKLPATNGRATTNRPVGAIPAAGGSYAAADASAQTTSADLAGATVSPSGGQQPVDVMPPYLVSRYIIALQGYFPQRP